MKKMNNSGFAISSLLYGLLLVAFLIVSVLMSTMASNRKNTTNLIEKIDDELSRHSNAATKFDSNGDVQEFIVPYGMAGWYRIELWGAAAAGTTGDSGNNRGSYVSGTIYLEENVHLYFYLGGIGKPNGKAYNQVNTSNPRNGGATDVRLVSGGANSEDVISKDSIIMSAGGGVNDKLNTDTSMVVGYNDEPDYINEGTTYSFTAVKIFDSVTEGAGKAKIDLVSRNPKEMVPSSVDSLNTNQPANYYISLASDPGRVLTAVDNNPSKLLFYDGYKKQKWTIKRTADLSKLQFILTETENNKTLQPEKTDSDGLFEENTNVATLTTYGGNIWEHWVIEKPTSTSPTDTYMIKPVKDETYCLTASNLTQHALFKLKKCNPIDKLQIFKLYSADY